MASAGAPPPLGTNSTMVNCSLTDPTTLSARQYNGTGSYNDAEYEFEDIDYNVIELFFYYRKIFSALIILVNSFGIFGNGMVIWLLVFHIKRNPFTTYVLNLAMADFGFLTTLIIVAIIYLLQLTFLPLDDITYILVTLLPFICFSQFSASQYLLTVISIDRAVSVFFPIWHQCHRPTKFSPIVSVLIWLLSYLPSAICLILLNSFRFYYVTVLQLTVSGLLCLPLMIISNLMIFIKVCYKSRQRRRRKLLITLLVTVSFFCFLSLPFNISYAVDFDYHRNFIFHLSATFCACLNSSVNPLIYYLVGRPRKGHSNKSMKVVLQKLFKEEEV